MNFSGNSTLVNVTTVLVAALMLVSCRGDGENDVPAEDSKSPPKLLMWGDESKGGPSMEASVRGTLRVNKNGCFAVNDQLLIAPPDSRVTDVGGKSGIELAGLGFVALGQQLPETAGGVLRRDELPQSTNVSDCLDEDEKDAEVVFLTP